MLEWCWSGVGVVLEWLGIVLEGVRGCWSGLEGWLGIVLEVIRGCWSGV